MTQRTEPTNCLHCGKHLDAIGDVGDAPDQPGPQPGNPVACLGCGAVQTVDERGNLRPFTEQEAEALAADPETMRELKHLVGVIHVVSAARN